MDLDQLREYVSEGREIEFKFNGKKYSITYGVIVLHMLESITEEDIWIY